MIADSRHIDLRAIERPLQRQLLVMAVAVFGLGSAFGGWHWGLAAALGVASGMVYYKILAAQVSRQFSRTRMPNVVLMIGFLAGRQLLSLSAPAICYFTLGTAWLACLVMLVVARHWILIVAWRGGASPAFAPS